jgi:molybdate transport system permease protein
MNRLFNFAIVAVAVVLAVFLLALILSTVAELGRSSSVKPPHVSEIFFAIKLSLFTATLASVFALIVSVPVAYMLSRCSFFGKSMLDTLLDLPIVLSPIALGAMLLIFFNTPVGQAVEARFGQFVFEVRGIVLAQFFVVVGLSIRLLKTTFEGIDIEYENLARTLGYNRIGSFRRVVVPLAGRGILASFLLVWGRAFGEFGATVTLAGATR